MTEKEFLRTYDSSKYERPSVTVDMLIFSVIDKGTTNYRKLPDKQLKVLLIKRKNHPFKDTWALPGGFVDINESLLDAAKRELKEETSIENIYMEQLYTYGDVNRDPRTRVISCAYMALIDSNTVNVKASDDAKEAEWFDVSYKLVETKDELNQKIRLYQLSLTNGNTTLDTTIKVTSRYHEDEVKREIVSSHGLAFDHGMIISYGIERLRNKILYTDIAFCLLKEEFTLTELQQVYEVILDKELLKANFRRKIADMVIKTDKVKKDAGHRPSAMYRYNPNWEEENMKF